MSEESVRHERRNARVGLVLFAIYLAVYAGFVGLCAFAPSVMATLVLGMRLSIAYGFFLILFAIVLAFIYTSLTRDKD